LFEALDYLLMVILVVNSIVIITCTRYYIKTKIPEFLIFSFAFYFSVYFSIYTSLIKLVYTEFIPLNQALGTVYESTPEIQFRIAYFINGISIPGLLFFLGVYFLRANWVHPPKRLWILMITGFLINIVVYLPVVFNSNLNMGFSKNQAILIRAWAWFIPVLFYALLCLRLYPKLQNPIHLTAKTAQAIKLWKIMYILTWIWATNVLIWRIYITITLDVESNITEGFMNLGSLLAALPLIIAAYVAIRHPEGLLIFHTQIIRTRSLYNSIVEKEKKSDSKPLTNIEDYLMSIPSDLYKQIPHAVIR